MDFLERALLNADEQAEFCKLVSSPVGRQWVDSGRKGDPSPEWLIENNDLGGILQMAVLFEWKGFMRNAPVRFIELTLHKHLCLMQAGKPNRCMAYHLLVFVAVMYASDSTREFVSTRVRNEGTPGDITFFQGVWLDTASTLLQEIWRGEFNRDNAPIIIATQMGWLASTWLERDRKTCVDFLKRVNDKVARCVTEANMTQMFKKEQKQLKNTALNEREKKIWSRFYDGDTEFLRQVFTNALREQLKPRKHIRNGGRGRAKDPSIPPEQRPSRSVLEECAQYAAEIGIDPADVDQL